MDYRSHHSHIHFNDYSLRKLVANFVNEGLTVFNAVCKLIAPILNSARLSRRPSCSSDKMPLQSKRLYRTQRVKNMRILSLEELSKISGAGGQSCAPPPRPCGGGGGGGGKGSGKKSAKGSGRGSGKGSGKGKGCK